MGLQCVCHNLLIYDADHWLLFCSVLQCKSLLNTAMQICAAILLSKQWRRES